ncbi:guanylate cyclase 32E-like [Coccinella septempunctata]|uniref:guanylate cyclase 32E-like n=1 Tax=Coccinella septempunctata TaxID=41139 RepID=UPI001D07E893|nr:guanylate cyclase 32E-like [Coccinella septempunctata]
MLSAQGVLLLIIPYITAETFTVGYITGSQRHPGDFEYSKPGRTISGAISLAVEEINNGTLGKMGHQLKYIVAETFGKEVISVQKTADLWKMNVSGYIGPQETCEHEAFLASAFNLPMISYYCIHHATSDKSKFPTFARTRPPDTQISKSVASVLLAFKWTHVILLYLKSADYEEFEQVAEIIKEVLRNADITVTACKNWYEPFHYGYDINPFYAILEETYRDTRIFVILGHHYEHLGLMIAMEDLNLFDEGNYFVVGVDIEQYDARVPQKYMKGLLKTEKIPVADKAFRYYLGIVPSSPLGYENFSKLVNEYMELPPFSFPNPSHYVGGRKMIPAEAAYLYDAVHLYARALISALKNGTNPRNGTAIIEFMKETHYKSAMGYIVYMDENGDAEGNYTLIARKPLSNNSRGYGLFPVGNFALRNSNTKLPILNLHSQIDWFNGYPPIAVPVCGFRGENCISHTIEILYGVTGGVFLILLIIFFALYRNWRYEQELDSLIWKIDFRDIQMNDDEKITSKATRQNHPLIRTSQVSLSSNPDADFRYSTIFTQIGIYKGRVFAMKNINKKSIDITREMKKELKMMKDLQHDNLNSFIGACTEPPNICIITEYCTRGSLKDILENEDVKLDNMFIASLVSDILRGVIYLHESPIRFHGSLHTGNCLVDSRWVVKLTDFGLKEFKRGISQEDLFKDPTKTKEKFRKLLYRAPEILRMSDGFDLNNTQGSQKGDSYAFGIILFELYNRHGPFGDSNLLTTEILTRIKNVTSPPFRPPIESLENSFDFVRDCLKECWQENPEDRPDFKSIRTKLRPLRKGMKSNIFDNMMAMMEKYANNLEVLVDERTDQLQEEKKKTESLLYEMLPRSVADQLKKGNKVEAECFDCVTIYFSDIVGFTSMSAESTPLQVVDFLNDLYTCFDSILENYDVYKVETIGDAYMVVSGLPIRNENQHAAEIATMSLHLLSAVSKFTIRHRQKEKLLLRIGIHSGPVCAGVVGLKMPRYCLFGDTVNTASRMESTGMPLKIHCSEQCGHLLNIIGGYHLVERGFVNLKGKGEQKTYWLLGEDPYSRQMRTEQRKIRRGIQVEKSPRSCITDSSGHVITRSSLKSKNNTNRSPIPRCSSFESPKRLRFASPDLSKKTNQTQFLEVISDDGSNHMNECSNKRRRSCRNSWKGCSSSCPCIEELTNSTNLPAKPQFSKNVTENYSKTSCSSVPSLYPHLSVPHQPIIHTLSAPSSPRKPENFVDNMLSKFPECEEVIPWPESTPLLKITEHQSYA